MMFFSDNIMADSQSLSSPFADLFGREKWIKDLF
jgi:hypothetical protein